MCSDPMTASRSDIVNNDTLDEGFREGTKDEGLAPGIEIESKNDHDVEEIECDESPAELASHSGSVTIGSGDDSSVASGGSAVTRLSRLSTSSTKAKKILTKTSAISAFAGPGGLDKKGGKKKKSKKKSTEKKELSKQEMLVRIQLSYNWVSVKVMKCFHCRKAFM